MTILAILFDLDDTLIVEEAYAEESFLAACKQAQEAHGTDAEAPSEKVREQARLLWRASPTIDYCRAIGISSWEGLWARFLGDDQNLKALRAWAPTYRQEAWSRALAEFGVHDPALAAEMSELYQKERRSRRLPFGDAEPTLRALGNRYKLALITNGVPDLQRDKIRQAGLGHYFDPIVVSGEIGVGKPDAKIFRLTLEQLAVTADQAAIVGDSLGRDIAGAQHAGITGIWLNRAGKEQDGRTVPAAEIASLAELRGVIEKLGN